MNGAGVDALRDAVLRTREAVLHATRRLAETRREYEAAEGQLAHHRALLVDLEAALDEAENRTGEAGE